MEVDTWFPSIRNLGECLRAGRRMELRSLTVLSWRKLTICQRRVAVDFVQVQQRETLKVFSFPLGASPGGSIVVEC